ncbi:MAG: hypothetical protein ABI823_02960 [Bryobacteraceae bacterium]
MADDYKSKLEQFFALVPKTGLSQYNNQTGAGYYGEVPSGTPAFQMRKDNMEQAKKDVAAAIAGKLVKDNDKFKTLTGLTHTQLLTNWLSGGIMTSCNGFVGKAGEAAGVKGLGGFGVEATLAKMGKRHCWISPLSGEKPQWGDVFETLSRTDGNDYMNQHVGINLSVEGEDWYTIEGGQGGRGLGFDRVARVKKKYRTSDVLGWVDMRLLASGKPALPDWLVGTWMIYAGSKTYVYSFDRYGEVTQQAYRPSPLPNGSNGPTLDKGTMLTVSGDSAKVGWHGEGGLEAFTYDRYNSFPGILERMNGVAADRSSMNGVRI